MPLPFRFLALPAALLVVLSGCGESLTGDETERDESGEVVEEGEVGALSLQLGDCLDAATTEVDSVPVVPCAEPHESEVVALFDLPEGDYPGAEAVIEAAETGCTGERFTSYVGIEYPQSQYLISYLVPTEQTWDAIDDREIVCLVTGPDAEPLVGSVEGRAD
jgi:hypothetical protein